MPRALVNKIKPAMKKGGKKPEPLNYFNNLAAAKATKMKKAIGGSMLEGTESTMSAMDNPRKKAQRQREKQARQRARQQKTFKRKGVGGCGRKKRVRVAGVWQEICLDNMA